GPAAVHVAGGVELHAVGGARLVALGLGPHTAAGERVLRRDVEHADVPARGVVDEQALFVQRKAEAVGTLEVVHEQLRRLRIGPHAEHALKRQFLWALDTIELGAAVWRVAEVDAAVRLAHDVVGAVELLALPVRGDRHDGAVWTRERHLAAGVLTREQAALAIVGEAIGHVARLAKRGDTVLGRPAPHVIARHVAPQQEFARRMPHRSLGKEEAAAELLEASRHLLPGLPATYQSGAASRGSLHTSVIVSVTRRAICPS